jgi:hypothetical protein
MAFQEMIKGFHDFLNENVDPRSLHPAEIQVIIDELTKKWGDGYRMFFVSLEKSIVVNAWWVTNADSKTALARSNRVAGPFARKEDAEKALLNLKKVKSPDFFKDIHSIDKKNWRFAEIPLHVEEALSYIELADFLKIAQKYVNIESLLSKKKGLIGGKKIGLI